jgi:hypothetical protein
MSKKPVETSLPPDEGLSPVPDANRPGHHPDVDPDKPLVPHPRLRVVPPDPATGESDATTTRFGFAFEPLLVPAALAFGVTPATAWVSVTDGGTLDVRFGPWSLRTPVANIASWGETGPYRLVKVAGPPHLSFADGGVTFATTRRGGLCIRFHDPVPAIAPFGLLAHPAATVTVRSPAQLASALERATTVG